MTQANPPATGPQSTLLDEVTRLTSEEAHLIGQELQGALNGTELKRLQHVSELLDSLDETLTSRRHYRAEVHGEYTPPYGVASLEG